MPTATRIFLLPSSASNEAPTVQILIDNITRMHPDAEALPSWRLDHRLFRESFPQASTGVNGISALPSRCLQSLSISHDPGMTYLAVSEMPSSPPTSPPTSQDLDAGSIDPGTTPVLSSQIIAIPPGNDTDELMQIIAARFSPLWTLRQVMQVVSGIGFEGGGFQVRFGELKVGSGVREIVVEVGVEDGDGAVEEQTEGFWSGLGMDPGQSFGKGDGIQAWLEVLRSR